MAENYDETLAIFKKLQEGGATEAIESAPRRQNTNPDAIIGGVDYLNEAVFGKYQEDANKNVSGQNVMLDTMKAFKTGTVSEEDRQRVEENIRKSKLPKAILSEMVANPILDDAIGSDEVDILMERLQGGKNKNISGANKIIQKLDERDKKQTTPAIMTETPVRNMGSFDYEKLEAIIESVFDRKFAQLSLNESRMGATPSIKAIQEKDGSRFLMVDTDDNVYECTLTYKGKNRRK